LKFTYKLLRNSILFLFTNYISVTFLLIYLYILFIYFRIYVLKCIIFMFFVHLLIELDYFNVKKYEI